MVPWEAFAAEINPPGADKHYFQAHVYDQLSQQTSGVKFQDGGVGPANDVDKRRFFELLYLKFTTV